MRINKGEFSEAEFHVICCLLEDYCMVYQLIGSFIYHQGCTEEYGVNAIIDALISLARDTYIEIECPKKDEHGVSRSVVVRKNDMLKKLRKMKADFQKNYLLSDDRYIWVQLSEKGFNVLNHLGDEC